MLDFVLGLLVYLYHYIDKLWQYIFRRIGSIYLVYYLSDKTENITFNYYTGYRIATYQQGSYFVKILNENGINYIAFTGNLNDLKKISFPEDQFIRPLRKTVILSNNGDVLNTNLEIIDNYRQNMMLVSEPIANLGLVTKLLGIVCTDVCVIQTMPFAKQTMCIDDVDINFLYQ